MEEIEKYLLSESEIVLGLRNKDPRSIEHIYNMYYKKVFSFILYIVKDKVEAEEVLQDTFVKVWQNIESYDARKSAFYTWIINICRNLCLDKLKSKSYKNTQNTISIDNSNANYSDFIAANELNHASEFLNKLSKDSAILLDLVYYKGYTHVEASTILNKPLGTIKTNIRSAIIELRKLLN